MSDRLLEAYSELDEFARSDDPQGYLTRFGEGVILLESFAREFNLDLPELLVNGRRATGYGLLNAEQKDCLNGWVKAIVSQSFTVRKKYLDIPCSSALME